MDEVDRPAGEVLFGLPVRPLVTDREGGFSKRILLSGLDIAAERRVERNLRILQRRPGMGSNATAFGKQRRERNSGIGTVRVEESACERVALR